MTENSYSEKTRAAIDLAVKRLQAYRVDGSGNVWVTEYRDGKRQVRRLG